MLYNVVAATSFIGVRWIGGRWPPTAPANLVGRKMLEEMS